MSEGTESTHNNRIVIIGGCGFVGINLTLTLSKRDYFILVLDVADLPNSLLYQNNIIYQKYDILLDDHLPQILKNFKPSIVVDIAGWGMSGPDMLRERCLWINVDGTENVIKACMTSGIRRLIFTSTYNVVFCGKEIVNGDESIPYAKEEDHLDKYSLSKAKAEKLVLDSNGLTMKNKEKLITSVIRPAAIYGEDERRHLPRILKHIDQDLFQFRIGQAIVDWVHVENLVSTTIKSFLLSFISSCLQVQAYLRLIEKMVATEDHTSAPAGQAYFISDGSPIDNFLFLKPLCEARGKRFPKLILPYKLFFHLCAIMESFYHIVEATGLTLSIPLTRAEVVKVGVTHFFSIEKARKELGYNPEFDSQVGAARLALHYSKWNDDDYFEVADWYWYLSILAGLWLTFRVAFYESYANHELILGYKYIEWLSFTIFRTQTIVQFVFYAAILAHLVEGLIAYYVARTSFKNTKNLWFLQTLCLGYPSLRLVLNRVYRSNDAQVVIN